MSTFIGQLVGFVIIVAIVLIAAYLGITGKRSTGPRV